MRLGFLCSEYPPDPHGGIGVFVRDLAHGLARAGHEVFVMGHGRARSGREEGGVHVRLLEPPAGFLPTHCRALWRRVHLGRALARAARQWRLDLLEVPDYHGEGAFLPRLPCPVLVRCHGATSVLSPLAGRRASRMTRFFEGRTLRRADVRVSISRFLEQRTVGAFPHLRPANAIVPNAVHGRFLHTEAAAERFPRQLLFVGRYTRQKGFHRLARIVKPLFAQFADATLHIAGGDGGEALDRLHAALGAEPGGRVVHHGRLGREELARVYAASSLLLLPTRAEAFSLATVEAMACGCVPVVAPGSGPAEIVAHGETGFIAPTVGGAEWTNLLRRILERPDDLAPIRENARGEAARRYHPSACLEHNLDVYHEAVSRWRGRP